MKTYRTKSQTRGFSSHRFRKYNQIFYPTVILVPILSPLEGANQCCLENWTRYQNRGSLRSIISKIEFLILQQCEPQNLNLIPSNGPNLLRRKNWTRYRNILMEDKMEMKRLLKWIQWSRNLFCQHATS